MQIRPGSTGEIKTMFKDQRFVDFFLNAILMYIFSYLIKEVYKYSMLPRTGVLN